MIDFCVGLVWTHAFVTVARVFPFMTAERGGEGASETDAASCAVWQIDLRSTPSRALQSGAKSGVVRQYGAIVDRSGEGVRNRWPSKLA